MTDRTASAVREPAVVTIPAGDFLMGSEDAKANERPVHQVWVDAFALAVGHAAGERLRPAVE